MFDCWTMHLQSDPGREQDDISNFWSTGCLRVARASRAALSSLAALHSLAALNTRAASTPQAAPDV